MLHVLGQSQQQDQCLLIEDKEDCFLELTKTLDGAYVTINSNSKTSSEVSRHHSRLQYYHSNACARDIGYSCSYILC